MKFTFNVGKKEIHTISLYYSKLLGKIVIKVDEKEIISTYRFLINPSKKYSEAYKFQVGGKEKHTIEIKKPTKLFPAFRTKDYEVYIDEKLFNKYSL